MPQPDRTEPYDPPPRPYPGYAALAAVAAAEYFRVHGKLPNWAKEDGDGDNR